MPRRSPRSPRRAIGDGRNRERSERTPLSASRQYDHTRIVARANSWLSTADRRAKAELVGAHRPTHDEIIARTYLHVGLPRGASGNRCRRYLKLKAVLNRLTDHLNRWDGTTPTDMRSRCSRTRRRGGQLLARARSPSSKNGLPIRVARRSLFWTVAPYPHPIRAGKAEHHAGLRAISYRVPTPWNRSTPRTPAYPMHPTCNASAVTPSAANQHHWSQRHCLTASLSCNRRGWLINGWIRPWHLLVAGRGDPAIEGDCERIECWLPLVADDVLPRPVGSRDAEPCHTRTATECLRERSRSAEQR